MSSDLTFDEIRPYYDHEVNEVLQGLTSEPSFNKILNYLYPEWDIDHFKKIIRNINSIDDFQREIVYEAIARVVKMTTDGLYCEGLENLDKEKSYIFISNHRDIILDSALLNFIIYGHGFKTTEVAIGDNLLISKVVIDLVKLNRNFVVHRNVPTRQLYQYSLRLSAYIHHTLKDKNTSVWIAQKEGRTKDGNDKTQSGLLKMFGIASQEDFLHTYLNLNIVPVSISYEYEPCDNLKAAQIYKKQHNLPLSKTQQEDRDNMVAGVTEPKGRIHFSIGRPIKDELYQLNNIPVKNEQIKALAKIIDLNIYKNYKLWPTNYMAYDLLYNEERFRDKYTAEEKNDFIKYINKRINIVSGDKDELNQYLLNIYANPVVNNMGI
jgi:1-acyl-sn-glycerol-3-phosphate acyltransferase